jgi:hypothetical protein
VLAVALAGCVALNADPFALGNRFLKDEAIKQAVITRAGKAPPAGGDPVAATARQVDAVAELELPFGWAPVNRPHGTSEWLGKLLGWLVAAISIPLARRSGSTCSPASRANAPRGAARACARTRRAGRSIVTIRAPPAPPDPLTQRGPP